MAKITIDIPDAKLSRVTDTMKWLFPIPVDEKGDPEFTDNQWGKEALRRFIRNQVQRYETVVAKEAVAVAADDSIAT